LTRRETAVILGAPIPGGLQMMESSVVLRRGRSMRRRGVVLVAALLGAAALASAHASRADAALRAADLEVVNRATTVRVVVGFVGSPPLTGLANQVDALDPDPADGRAAVRINARGITTTVAPVTAAGITARISQRRGSIVVLIDGAPGRFKFVQYKVSVPLSVVVIDLWKATTRRAATVLDDGCLRLVRWSGGRGVARARGLELEPLFEHGLVLSLRAENAGGSTIALRPLTATEGVFRPDFSGYAVPGRWRGSLPYTVAARRRAMLEAWSTSAKDGSLECLVQVPVLLRP
jgi:hypothetical protein